MILFWPNHPDREMMRHAKNHHHSKEIWEKKYTEGYHRLLQDEEYTNPFEEEHQGQNPQPLTRADYLAKKQTNVARVIR